MLGSFQFTATSTGQVTRVDLALPCPYGNLPIPPPPHPTPPHTQTRDRCPKFPSSPRQGPLKTRPPLLDNSTVAPEPNTHSPRTPGYLKRCTLHQKRRKKKKTLKKRYMSSTQLSYKTVSSSQLILLYNKWSLFRHSISKKGRGPLGSPVVPTLHFQCRRHGFDPWLGN